MRDPYETCPVCESEKVLPRLIEAGDTDDLLSVYSDEQAGFVRSEEVLIGGDDGKTYADYYERKL